MGIVVIRRQANPSVPVLQAVRDVDDGERHEQETHPRDEESHRVHELRPEEAGERNRGAEFERKPELHAALVRVSTITLSKGVRLGKFCIPPPPRRPRDSRRDRPRAGRDAQAGACMAPLTGAGPAKTASLVMTTSNRTDTGGEGQ